MVDFEVPKRMWRKNRNDGVFCQTNTGHRYNVIGVDLNRNFPAFSKDGDTINTITNNTIGISDAGISTGSGECGDTYNGGTHAISEPETKTVQEYIRSIKADSGVIAAVDVHCYSEIFFIPDNLEAFGFGRDKEVMVEIGEAMARAVSKVDPSSDYLTLPPLEYPPRSIDPRGDIMDYWFYGEGKLISILFCF